MPREILSEAFVRKKKTILKSLGQSEDTYTDKSPKGSVDAPIIDLIAEINDIDGLVTTSSCSGRVAVFVEGSQAAHYENLTSEPDAAIIADDDGLRRDAGDGDALETSQNNGLKLKVKTGPGGKGGGKWLYVSHDPVPFGTGDSDAASSNYFTRLCGLDELEHATNHDYAATSQTRGQAAQNIINTIPTTHQLIKLSFSPLILHVLTADLSRHARPLLAAAINAGFRESGVQSLAALDPITSAHTPSSNTGTMLAVRTAGIGFETVIGQVITLVDSGGTVTESIRPLVDESYLRMCFEVINERFVWNLKRKERLRSEIQKAFARVDLERNWESKEDRRRRKREQGLKIKAEKETASAQSNAVHPQVVRWENGVQPIENLEQLDDGLGLNIDLKAT